MAQDAEEDISEATFSTAARLYAPKVARTEAVSDVGTSVFYGAYGRYHPFEIPNFHGIPPTLGLSYSSQATGDIAGVGWSLHGFSRIELFLPDVLGDLVTNDTTRKSMWRLDGEKLLLCSVVKHRERSSSCANGGTHTTRTESYQRIVWDPETDTWTVWNTNGTRVEYVPVGSRPGYDPPFHTVYGVESIVDSNGNKVSFGWDRTPDGDVVYPKHISYNPVHRTIVRFVYSDTQTVQTSGGFLRRRLEAVQVTVDDEMLRGYKLRYAVSEATGRSLLTSIEEYGRDSTLDYGHQWVLPEFSGRPKDSPATFSYSSGGTQTLGEHVEQVPSLPTIQQTNSASLYSDTGIRPIDFNGDGLVDFLLARALKDGAPEKAAWLNTGNGFSRQESSMYWTDQTGGQLPSFYRRGCGDQGVRIGDMNGDGLQDIVQARAQSGSVTHGAWLNTGSGWYRDDSYATPASNVLNLYFASGNCTRPSSDVGVRLVDINGDGRSDLVHMYDEFEDTLCEDLLAHSRGVYLNLPREENGVEVGVLWTPTPTGIYDLGSIPALTVKGCWKSGDQGIRFLELNGDGLTDMLQVVYHHKVIGNVPYSGNDIRAWINTGRGFRSAPEFAYFSHDMDVFMDDPPYVVDELHFRADAGVRIADINGDGKSDVVQSFKGNYLGVALDFPHTELRRAWVSTGNGWERRDDLAATLPFFVNHDYDSGLGYYTYRGKTGTLLIDINGDGATDVLQSYAGDVDGSWRDISNAWLSPNRHRDLLEQATTKLGLREDVAYEPSTTWPNGRPIVVVPTVAAIARAEYPDDPAVHVAEYSYEGAAFDATDRVFNGFQRVEETLPPLTSGEPNDRPYREFLFRQDVPSRGKLARITVRSSDGARLWQQSRSYDVSAEELPYTSVELERTTFFCGDAGDCATHVVGKTYDSYGNTRTVTDHGSDTDDTFESAFLYSYDTSRYIVDRVRQSDIYDRDGRVIRRTVNYYDAAGNLRDNYRYAGDNLYVGRHFEYYSNGKLMLATDELGRQTRYIRDDGYYANEIQNPLYETDARQREIRQWDTACDRIKEVTDENNLTTATEYDEFCRLHHVTNPAGDTRLVRYWKNPSSGLSVTTNLDNGAGDGQWKVEEFDGFAQLRETRREGPNDTSDEREIFDVWRQYDGHGRVVAEARPHYCGERSSYEAGPDARLITRMYYDALGRPKRTVMPDGNEKTWSYDTLTATMTDERGAKTRTVSDVWGRVVEASRWIEGAWHSVHYQYDEVGQLLQVDDEDGNVITFRYDPLGRQTFVSHPDTGDRSFRYDAAGQLYESEDATGQVTRTTHDALGRALCTEIGFGTNAAERYCRYYDWHRDGYFNVGQVTTEAFGGTFRVLNHDETGNVVYSLVENGESHLTTWNYDAWSRLLNIHYPDGDRLGTNAAPIEYDDAGRLMAIPGVLDSVEYTADGRPLLRSDASGASVEYDYTPDRGFLERIAIWSNGTVVHALSHTHKENGFVESVSSTEPSQSWVYDYDEAGRLAYAEHGDRDWEYHYTPFGNLIYNGDTGESYTYPEAGSSRPHAPVSVGGDVLSYDDNGNRLEGRGRKLVWNADGRLIAANGARFGYEASGRRYLKSENGANTFYFDGGVEYSKGTYTKYITAGGAGLVAKRVGSTTWWLHTDHLGSIVGVGDASGDIDIQAFRPYGEPGQRVEGEGRGFTGQRHDGTGLIYLNDRYYDPGTAVFLSADRHFVLDPTEAQRSPIEAVNAYQYGLNNPVNNRDRSGKAVETVWDAGNVAMGVAAIAAWDENTSISTKVLDVGGLVVDVAGTLVPFVPAGIAAVLKSGRVAGKAGDAAGVARGADKAADGAKATSNGVKSSVNKLGPHPKAQGPHTRFKKDGKGKVQGYTTFDAHGNPVKRFRGTGKPHGGQEPPLVLEPKPGKGPGSPPKVPRPPRPDEMPKGY
jgi:RHS repeat-associated protein